MTGLTSQGEALFAGRQTLKVDSIVYCTGYQYSFPFLEGTGLVSTGTSPAGHLATSPSIVIWLESGIQEFAKSFLGQKETTYWLPAFIAQARHRAALPTVDARTTVLWGPGNAQGTEQRCRSAAEDGHVYPLYKHIFAPTAPSLSFVGLLWKSLRFPQFELQVSRQANCYHCTCAARCSVQSGSGVI